MMSDDIKDIVPLTTVRGKLSAIIERVHETKRPLFATQNGRAAVVILDAAQYHKTMGEYDLYRALSHGLASKTTHTIGEVESELDAIVSE